MNDDENDSFNEVIKRSAVQNSDVNASPVLDMSELDNLFQLIGKNKSAEIVESFKKDIDERMGLILSGQLTHKEMERQLHAMTSCSGSLGLKRFSLLARRMMNQIEEDKLEEAENNIIVLKDLYYTSFQELQKSIA